jgi:hypothetical protein
MFVVSSAFLSCFRNVFKLLRLIIVENAVYCARKLGHFDAIKLQGKKTGKIRNERFAKIGIL